MHSNIPERLNFKAGLSSRTAPGVLGFHTHFEVTEVFGYRDGNPPVNLFTVMVAEEHTSGVDEITKFLGQRIRLKSLKGWTFGIQRYRKRLSDIEQALDHYDATGEWMPSGKLLGVGALVPVPTQFVPPDSTTVVPLNLVLKNNFWNGSHVFELADQKKTSLQPFLVDPRRLQELSAAIQKEVPIRLASLSDRLGNVLIQVPVTVISCRFWRRRETGDCVVELQWHPQATERVLRVSCETQFDKMVTGYASANIQTPKMVIPVGGGDGMRREFLWDDQHQVILAATGGTAHIETIGLNLRSISPEPRTFIIKDNQGQELQVRVGMAASMKSHVGAPVGSRSSDWARRRIYRDEAERLATARNFVQYKPEAGKQSDVHEKALQDIRYLLNSHGEDGAWLWDPYLSAQDILETLFFCQHANADLRALSAAKDLPESPQAQVVGAFAETQRKIFDDAKSNLQGLRLEFRMKVGAAGWAFHDRFLIFPKKDGGALAWSLGTSVNSIGRQHHILQRVDDGQMVMEAFSELWDALNGIEHLVWKRP